jgi:Protein of unknown function (DUF2911)
MRNIKYIFTLCLVGAFSYSFAQSPPMKLPRASQASSLIQKVGLVDLEINYSRPGVKGREIFGKLIPYDKVWRAGANENTTISFSRPVKIGGNDIPAGIYGLHIIPTEGDWTLIINEQSNSWGSFFYDESKDVGRVSGKVSKLTENQEWLAFDFDNITDHSCDIVLRWANTKVSFPIEIETNDQILTYIENEYLTGIPGFFWDGFNNAALYCARQNIYMDKALEWTEISIKKNKNFSNLSTKYLILKKSGKADEAKKVLAEAMPMGKESEINNFGYVMMGEGEVDEAIKLFQHNVKEHPKSWNVWDSLAESYAKKGDKANATKNYKKALSLTDDKDQKERIEKTLSDLSS